MQNIFKEILGAENVFVNEKMSKHTTFHIGGKADYLLVPQNINQIKLIAQVCRDKGIDVFILGCGSNILVGDGGIRGVVLKIEKGFDSAEVRKEDKIIVANAGIHLTKLSNIALNAELSGFECLSGIPGTLGGAIYMNAGAYGDEIQNHIIDVTFIDEDLEVKTIKKEECNFGYRKSIFTDTKKIILSATLKFEDGCFDKIKEKIAEHTKMRVTKQPIEKFSAGSTFKRPEGNFAGTLIEQAGLKGKKIGGAEVSEKHAGFIINSGDATAKDVLDLVKFVQNTVYEKSGVMLEPEIKKIGEF